MPKVNDAHREARQEQILDAALRCFAEKGFHRSSMADIVAEAGLSPGAIYLQFESKQHIAVAVARRALGGRRDELQHRLDSGALYSPGDVLDAMLGGLTRDFIDTRVIVQLWGEAVADREMSSLVVDVFRELQAVSRAVLSAWAMRERGMSAAAADSYAKRTVSVVLGLGQGYLLQNALVPGFDAASYLAEAKQLLAAESSH